MNTVRWQADSEGVAVIKGLGGQAGADAVFGGAPSAGGESDGGEVGGERPGEEEKTDLHEAAVTREELNQLSFLQREIEGQRQRIRELRNTLKSPTMSGMPRSGGVSDPVARTVELIHVQEKLLLEGVERCLREQNRLLSFVQSVEDSRMRQILRYRHLDGLSWVQVAHRMNVTPESVKMAYKRFFDGRDCIR